MVFGSDSFELCLVGRLLSQRPFHADTLKSTLLLAFNHVRGMDLKPLEVLSSVALNENPQDVNLDWAVFHGLPLSKMSEAMAKFIDNQLGRFVDVDLDRAGRVWGSSMRIRVSMEVSKPLKRVLKLHTTLGDEQLLSFTYERLPNFCYLCGCLGHLSKFCELRFAEDFTDPGEATPFGPWMRATNLPTGRNRPLALSRNMSIPQFSPDQKSFTSPLTRPPHGHTPKGASIFGAFSSPTTSHPQVSSHIQNVSPSPAENPTPATLHSLCFIISSPSLDLLSYSNIHTDLTIHTSLPLHLKFSLIICRPHPLTLLLFPQSCPQSLLFPITHITKQTTTLTSAFPVLKARKVPLERSFLNSLRPYLNYVIPFPPVTESRIALSDISNSSAVATGVEVGDLLCCGQNLSQCNFRVSDRITLMSWFIRIPMPRPGEKQGRRPRLIWQMGRFREASQWQTCMTLVMRVTNSPGVIVILSQTQSMNAWIESVPIPFGGPDFPQQ
ncbi:UNVERIFIED_CONTAM: hypothetical protein Scaly_0692600, partial [Sesamum calycinum]